MPASPQKNTAPASYDQLFVRNIGWVTHAEQASLKNKRVAIAGLGGVGGVHLLTLARLGIGKFNIADMDVFEPVNFNRQAGASLSTLGKPKVDVMASMALDINPQLELRRFPQGISESNLGDFLTGVDLYVDGLDFFAVNIRRAVFAACDQKNIPAITVAPLGMGAALLNFLPGHMTFEEYFGMEGRPEDEQLLRFLLGLAPKALHRSYLVDPTTIDLANHRGPSTPMACQLCAGVAGAQALKILLNRPGVIAAPHGLQFDAYQDHLVHTHLRFGHRNPFHRLKLTLAKHSLLKNSAGQTSNSPVQLSTSTRPIEQILDLARWAPSGDNTQPWRFQITSDTHAVVHAHDTREKCVYDLQGHASQIAVGAMLETLVIAASAHHWRTQFRLRPNQPETNPIIDVTLVRDAQIAPDPLLPFITQRVTQRRPMRTKPLTAAQIAALDASVGDQFKIRWFHGLSNRLRVANLLFRSAHIRLTTHEAYLVHREIIQWNSQFSEDRIPDQAVGLDAMTLKLMRWAMGSWNRIQFMNRFLAGTVAPRVQLDFMPALRCASHAVLLADKPPRTIDDFFFAGRALQRFWLTATQLGLQFQPEITPLIFASYVAANLRFCQSAKAWHRAHQIHHRLENLLGQDQLGNNLLPRAVFMARLGQGKAPTSRSLRIPLPRLILKAT